MIIILVKSNSASFKQLDPSFIAKLKNREKQNPDKVPVKGSSDINKPKNKENEDTSNKNENFNTKKKTNSSRNFYDEHIKLSSNQVKFGIGDELNSTICNITLRQLLDISPKNSKKNNLIGTTSNLNPSITGVNNIKRSYESNLKEVTDDELAIVLATMKNEKARLLVDTCSNINVGICNNRIRQVAVDYKKKEEDIIVMLLGKASQEGWRPENQNRIQKIQNKSKNKLNRQRRIQQNQQSSKQKNE
ncbi:hypothetical protein H8356DRAFT_1357017 [Neocallimastix lanati (nom. inval.)]|nr:hypothetical protein H8356DRAFT_1357017 [Neocallimastix sp. JGI-2020a]